MKKNNNLQKLLTALPFIFSPWKKLQRYIMYLKLLYLVQKKSDNVKRTLKTQVKHTPIQSLVIAALTGMVIGSLIKRRKK